MPKEPQSYGSERDWVSGDVGEEVNRQKSEPDPKHRDFYESRRDAEERSGRDQGGHPSDDQLANQQGPEVGELRDAGRKAAWKVTELEGGAKRHGYFKDRDYGR